MVEEEFSKTSIIQERVEFMVDPTASEAEQNPTKRSALFLNPSLNPNSVPPQFPKIQSFSSSSKPNVIFLCHSTPLKGWQTWVQNLEEAHEPAWRKAGIFDAIKGSTYHIGKVTDLIFSLAKKWCPETNTFIFPWGEATVTLEDVYVLGGFSPLGVSVLSCSSSLEENVKRVENKLIKLFRKLKEKESNLSQLRWQEHFMGCGNQIGYAGFLALWLARHVFPARNNSLVTRVVLAMAARISCGAKLAFGPVILASIYKDLTMLKTEIVGSLNSHYCGGRSLKLSSPLQLLQAWAWERFPSLGPVPRMIPIHSGGIRLARWECHLRKFFYVNDDIEMCLNSARETFRWRPYSLSIENWSLPRFYVNSGMWVLVDSNEEWKLLARCLMVGQLIGLNCVQNYNPHRVALQFGFDQDIPKSVDLSKSICTLDELGYRMNLKGLKLYLPARLHEGDLTYRYFDWWRTRLDKQEVGLVGWKRKQRTVRRVKKLAKIVDTSNEPEPVVVGNVRESSMEKSPPRDEFSRSLLQVGNDIGMACSLNMQCVLTSEKDMGMMEDNENEGWIINRSMGEGSKINVSCNKLAETKLSRGIDQQDGGMEQVEMLLERKQGCDAMNCLCSHVASKHPNLGNEIRQVMATSPLLRPEGDLGKSEDIASERNHERSLIKNKALYKDLNTNHGNGQVAASLPMLDKSDQKSFAARCLEYESRMSRLERVISALSVYKPT